MNTTTGASVRVIYSASLAGLHVQTQTGTVTFLDPPEGDADGGAGVREPRRPNPAPPALSAAAEACPQ